MKHIMIGKGWKYGTEPFPAYRASLWFGKNQVDREFLPVSDITPDEGGVLPAHTFKVVKTKEGVVKIVRGEEKSPRCLLFVGSTGGHRGGVEIVSEATSGKVLKTCSAENNLQSGIEVVVILDVGQSVVFSRRGRQEGDNQVVVYTWNGVRVDAKTWSKTEWDRRNDPARSEENVRWLHGNFRVVRLSGNDVSNGVTAEGGELVCRDAGRLAHCLDVVDGIILSARFGRDIHDELVIAPVKDGEQQVDQGSYAVLVHEYSPGCGRKRYPSFHIDWENAGAVKKLGEVYRGKGGGSDLYTLVIAPLGWAENIAAQFVDEQDREGQIITYKPEPVVASTPATNADVPATIETLLAKFGKKR